MAIYLSLKLKVITTSHELGNINMLKKSVLVFALLTSITSFSSMASLITQTNNFTGIAGNDSIGADAGSSISDLQFDKFDESLGELTDVHVSYILSISGGSIGATSNTSATSEVIATLGANVLLNSDLPFLKESGFGTTSMFDTTTVTQPFAFSLTGSGDAYTENGVSKFEDTGFVTILDSFGSTSYLDYFKTASPDTFGISFATSGINDVEATGGGVTGNFVTVSFDITVNLNYEYTAAPVPPVFGVPEPAVFAFGLLMLCAVTGRKFIK
ncbi:MAG: hypothetical protein ACI9MS_002924 [Glaciecola sp.]|jgi:hypothetical protein